MISSYSFEIVQKDTIKNLKEWPVLVGSINLPRDVEVVESVIASLRKGRIEFRVVSLSKFDNVVEVRRTVKGYRKKQVTL